MDTPEELTEEQIDAACERASMGVFSYFERTQTDPRVALAALFLNIQILSASLGVTKEQVFDCLEKDFEANKERLDNITKTSELAGLFTKKTPE